VVLTRLLFDISRTSKTATAKKREGQRAPPCEARSFRASRAFSRGLAGDGFQSNCEGGHKGAGNVITLNNAMEKTCRAAKERKDHMDKSLICVATVLSLTLRSKDGMFGA
jgi:hypothetical protein